MYRGLWNGYLWWAIPVTVVQDTQDLITLYWPAGTPVKRPETRATTHEILNKPKPILSDSHWTDTDILMLYNEGAPYSINAMRSSENGELLCWYINLQAPLHRMEIGFETEDHLLDVVFQPDLSNWHLKDEDELAAALQLGMYSDQKVKMIYAAADDAIQQIISGSSPISKMWASWTPPKEWSARDMPDDWDAYLSDPFR